MPDREMAKRITVRAVRPDDAENIVSWGDSVLPELRSRQTEMLCFENGKPISYATVQAVGMIRSIAANPDASTGDKVLALRELVSVMDCLFDEVIFMAGDEDELLERLAVRHGFELIGEWRCYRRTRKAEVESGPR